MKEKVSKYPYLIIGATLVFTILVVWELFSINVTFILMGGLILFTWIVYSLQRKDWRLSPYFCVGGGLLLGGGGLYFLSDPSGGVSSGEVILLVAGGILIVIDVMRNIAKKKKNSSSS